MPCEHKGRFVIETLDAKMEVIEQNKRSEYIQFYLNIIPSDRKRCDNSGCMQMVL